MSGRQVKRIRRETKRALRLHLANMPKPAPLTFWQRVKLVFRGRV